MRRKYRLFLNKSVPIVTKANVFGKLGFSILYYGQHLLKQGKSFPPHYSYYPIVPRPLLTKAIKSKKRTTPQHLVLSALWRITESNR